MTDPRADPSSRRAAGILVTGAAGTVGQAVVDVLVATGETVVAGVRDPRARIADRAKWASGTAAAGHRFRGAGTGTGTGRTTTTGPGGPGPFGPGSGPALPAGRPAAQPAARRAGKPVQAPNQKPPRNPAHKPLTIPAGSPAARASARPVAGPDQPPAASGQNGAVLRGFDFGDRGTWASALAGVDRVVLIRPLGVTDVARTIIPFIDTAMESGVRQIVFVSQLGRRFDTRSPRHAVEHYLKRTHAPYTVLRPNVLMQVLGTVCRDDIRLRDELLLPAGGARMALVDARDVARVAARVLTERGHLRKTYPLSGEQALGCREVAGILSEVLGRRIGYSAPTEAEYLALLAKQGIKPEVAAAVQAVYRVVRGRAAMRPSRIIRRLTGQQPMSVRQFIQEHREVWL